MKKLNLYKYTDFRKYLYDYYVLHKRNTRRFSYRYFSEKAGFSSHNVLKQVIHGERNIGAKSLEKFSHALEHTEREKEYFRLLVLFNQSTSEDLKNRYFTEMMKLKERLGIKEIHELQYTLYTQWYHVVIRELITLPYFQEDHDFISKALLNPVTSSQVKKSFTLLNDIGLISRNSKGDWVQEDPVIKTSPEVSSLSIRNHNRTMIRLAQDAMEKVDNEDMEITGITVRLSRKKYEEIKEKIQNFKNEILEYILNDTSESDGVYQFNCQFFPLVNSCISADSHPKNKNA